MSQDVDHYLTTDGLDSDREKMIGQTIGYRYDVNLVPDMDRCTPYLKEYMAKMNWSDLNWLEDVHMGYEEDKAAVFDRNIFRRFRTSVMIHRILYSWSVPNRSTVAFNQYCSRTDALHGSAVGKAMHFNVPIGLSSLHLSQRTKGPLAVNSLARWRPLISLVPKMPTGCPCCSASRISSNSLKYSNNDSMYCQLSVILIVAISSVLSLLRLFQASSCSCKFSHEIRS